jgi:hypothetical protein
MLVRNLNRSFENKAIPSRALFVMVKRCQEFDRAMSRNKKSAGSPEVERSRNSLNRFLRRYAARPMILPGYPGQERSPRGWHLEWIRIGTQKQLHSELRLMLHVVDIMLAGRITFLRQCGQCGSWFFGRQQNQRFCPGGVCQQEFHQFSEADRKRRREWARQNYQTRKELELGSRKAAKRKRGTK